ncbi:uncharacterized protein LOC103938667 [Pyrus x bretschneideri]|uniref:uncharacterized protein LOC103938667 n=1 Tax=Pyrus x bretschneideri TaxID=225117 RepID=UPI00202FFC64|nr:uncharacterized protein LOC103938667 [Pyrus x bretschneideri]
MALNLSGSDLEDEELERQVQEMAKKILEYRAILPDQLKNTLASILAAHRPAISDRSGPGTSGASSLDAGKVASIRRDYWLMEIRLSRRCNCTKIKFPAMLLPCILF